MSGKRWALAVVLGLLSLLVLQGAVIPTATQAVSAAKELLVREQNTDDSGFIRVHEQGTANVKAQQDGDWTVGIDPAMNTVVASESRTPVNIWKQVDMEGFDERDINMYKVPAGKTLIIKTISTRVVSSEASPNKWNVWLQIPSTDLGYSSAPTFYLNDFNEGPHGFTTASASVDIMVPSEADVFFAFHRSEPYEHSFANASFAGYLID